jgi:hypothetical protein
MAQDVFKPKGPIKSSRPEAGGANTRPVPVLGIVKDNIDPTRQGRIKVYLSETNSTTDPENRDNWRTVRYLSPFFGKTSSDGGNDTYGSYKANPSSYGLWNSPPDIGTTVVCIFINGDLNYGFYIGCVPEPESLQMVPAIGATDNIVPNEGEAQSYGGALRLPVTNINSNNKGIADSQDYLTAPKPVHSYTAAIMTQQGVIKDPVRGPISTSSQRESPSRVGWGVSTPGRPIYEGGFDDVTITKNLDANKAQQLRVVSRRGGHSIVMDDGDVIGRDNLIRIRTSLGHQILMSDDGQTLMLLHSNGQSYIELGKEGTVDVYSMNSVNIRTHGDLNLHADQNINIHAKKDLNIQAENMHFNSEKEFKQKVGADHQVYTAGKQTIKVDGAYSVESTGDASMASAGISYVNGSKVNLNTGKTSTVPQTVKQIPIVAHTDTLHDEVKGWLAAPGKLLSITSRAPAHAPWVNAGQGIDVKTDMSASGQLPQSASAPVAATNQAAGSSVPNPVQGSTVSSSPPVQAVSPSIDKNTTGAMLGQLATDVSKSPLAAAQSIGAAVAETANGIQVGVGQFAATAQQLESAGTIKQGAAQLVSSLAAKTGNAAQALQTNLFTGQPGAQNLTQLVNSVEAQANVAVSTFQKAQTQLTQTGAMTGLEAPQQVAGMVYSAATQGIGQTVSAIKDIASNPLGGLTNNIAGQANGVISAIGSGNFAAGVAQNVTGALGSIAASAEAASKGLGLADIENQAKGAAASAFESIKASIKPLQAGIPQNLTAIAQEAAKNSAITSALPATNNPAGASLTAAIQGGVGKITSAAQNAVQSGISSITTGKIPGGTSVAQAIEQAASTALNGAPTQAIQSITSAAQNFANPTALVQGSTAQLENLANAAISQATGKLAGTSSTIASGLSNLPGGQEAVSAVVNKATGKINETLGSIGSVTGLGNNIAGAATDAINGLAKGKLPDLGGLANKALAGLPSGVATSLQGAISSLSAGGQVPIKLPTVAINTVNREGLTAQIKSVLGDPGIPTPNLSGEVPESAKSDLEKKLDKQKELTKVIKELGEFADKQTALRLEYEKALATLPQGDPGIEKAKQAFAATFLSGELDALMKRYDEAKNA